MQNSLADFDLNLYLLNAPSQHLQALSDDERIAIGATIHNKLIPSSQSNTIQNNQSFISNIRNFSPNQNIPSGLSSGQYYEYNQFSQKSNIDNSVNLSTEANDLDESNSEIRSLVHSLIQSDPYLPHSNVGDTQGLNINGTFLNGSQQFNSSLQKTLDIHDTNPALNQPSSNYFYHGDNMLSTGNNVNMHEINRKENDFQSIAVHPDFHTLLQRNERYQDLDSQLNDLSGYTFPSVMSSSEYMNPSSISQNKPSIISNINRIPSSESLQSSTIYENTTWHTQAPSSTTSSIIGTKSSRIQPTMPFTHPMNTSLTYSDTSFLNTTNHSYIETYHDNKSIQSSAGSLDDVSLDAMNLLNDGDTVSSTNSKASGYIHSGVSYMSNTSQQSTQANLRKQYIPNSPTYNQNMLHSSQGNTGMSKQYHSSILSHSSNNSSPGRLSMPSTTTSTMNPTTLNSQSLFSRLSTTMNHYSQDVRASGDYDILNTTSAATASIYDYPQSIQIDKSLDLRHQTVPLQDLPPLRHSQTNRSIAQSQTHSYSSNMPNMNPYGAIERDMSIQGLRLSTDTTSEFFPSQSQNNKMNSLNISHNSESLSRILQGFDNNATSSSYPIPSNTSLRSSHERERVNETSFDFPDLYTSILSNSTNANANANAPSNIYKEDTSLLLPKYDDSIDDIIHFSSSTTTTAMNSSYMQQLPPRLSHMSLLSQSMDGFHPSSQQSHHTQPLSNGGGGSGGGRDSLSSSINSFHSSTMHRSLDRSMKRDEGRLNTGINTTTNTTSTTTTAPISASEWKASLSASADFGRSMILSSNTYTSEETKPLRRSFNDSDMRSATAGYTFNNNSMNRPPLHSSQHQQSNGQFTTATSATTGHKGNYKKKPISTEIHTHTSTATPSSPSLQSSSYPAPGSRHQSQSMKPRSDILDSPQSKNAFKDFYRNYRLKEKESLQAAYNYTLDALNWMPIKTWWKLKLELADMSKRKNDMNIAREYYKEACQLLPIESSCWLEYSKFEEECGLLTQSFQVLKEGLKHTFDEALLTRSIKILEKLHDIQTARNMLSMIKHNKLEQTWKVVLEGALFESRVGQIQVARELLKYLMRNISTHLPLFYDAFCLEEKYGTEENARKIVSRGLENQPRYGPLWFAQLRLAEREDIRLEEATWLLGQKPFLKHLKIDVQRAVASISKELIWKVYFQLAHSEIYAACIAAIGLQYTHHYHHHHPVSVDGYPVDEKDGNTCTSLSSINNKSYHIKVNDLPSIQTCRNVLFHDARLSLTRSLLSCPKNLRWKVWLAATRLELQTNNIEISRVLLSHAMKEAPNKSRGQIYLECARVEEYFNHSQYARDILIQAIQEMKNEWKLYLELILLEYRHQNYMIALKYTQQAIALHSGAGRLWIIFIQICHRFEYLSIRKKRPISADSPLFVPSMYPGNDLDDVKDPGDTNSILPISSADSTLHLSHVENISISTSTLSIPMIPNKDDILLKAVLEVPKSGEVWCEGARCYLNPLIYYSFDLSLSQRTLNFAIQFTPQYGDTFLEYLKLEMLCQVLLPRVLSVLGIPLIPFIKRYLYEDKQCDLYDIIQDSRSRDKLSIHIDCLYTHSMSNTMRHNRLKQIKLLQDRDMRFPNVVDAFKNITKSLLERRCINADPNYGTNWFYCRTNHLDSAIQVLHNTHHILVHELTMTQQLYNHAIYCYITRCLSHRRYQELNNYQIYQYSKEKHLSTDSTQSGQILPQSERTVDSAEEEIDPYNLYYIHEKYRIRRENELLLDILTSYTTIKESCISALPVTTATTAAEAEAEESQLNDINDINPLLLDETEVETTNSSRELTTTMITHILSHITSMSPSRHCPETVTLSDGTQYHVSEFITGLYYYNRKVAHNDLNDDDRFQLLFGSDQIMP